LKFRTQFEYNNYSFSPIWIGDAPMLLKAVSNCSFPKSLPLAQLKTLDQAESWCKSRASEWESGENFTWSCRQAFSSQLIGQVTLLPKDDRLALAYWVDPNLWGQGIATGMISALLTHITARGYRGRVWAGVHSWNKRSSCVLEKLGFKQIEPSKENTFEYILEIAC
jgi:RimJ/RimL family protein N-acetyltransferase